MKALPERLKGYALLIAAMLLAAGCATPGAWARYELCFGMSADGGQTTITDRQWQQFLDEEVVARFPDGFTVFETKGYWLSGEKTLTEPSRVLMVVAPHDRATRDKLADIAERYIRRFQQEAVLQIHSPATVVFHGE